MVTRANSRDSPPDRSGTTRTRDQSRAGARDRERPSQTARDRPLRGQPNLPQDGIGDYQREQVIDDLVDEAEADMRRSLERGAYKVQLDFTGGRVQSSWIRPSSCSGNSSSLLERFSDNERERIGVHTCLGIVCFWLTRGSGVPRPLRDYDPGGGCFGVRGGPNRRDQVYRDGFG